MRLDELALSRGPIKVGLSDLCFEGLCIHYVYTGLFHIYRTTQEYYEPLRKKQQLHHGQLFLFD